MEPGLRAICDNLCVHVTDRGRTVIYRRGSVGEVRIVGGNRHRLEAVR